MATKTKTLIALLVILVSAVAAVSRPGRVALKGLIGRVTSSSNMSSEAGSSAVASQSLDLEQRALAAHGWTSNIVNSISRGSIIYYDAAGRATAQYAITISRAYPDRVRVEIDRGQTRDIFGFDQTSAWRRGAANLTEVQARDIRTLARLCPERLFVTRGEDSQYREAGRRVEEIRQSATAPDWTATSRSPESGEVVYDQIEMIDQLGPAATRTNPGDLRRVSYYVESETSLVRTARWLEPDNPGRSIDDETASFTDIRVDFSEWREIDGIKWPSRITRWFGGKVAFRIDVNELLVNQQLADSVFRNPSQ